MFNSYWSKRILNLREKCPDETFCKSDKTQRPDNVYITMRALLSPENNVILTNSIFDLTILNEFDPFLEENQNLVILKRHFSLLKFL